MEDKPRISILCPTRNRFLFAKELILSATDTAYEPGLLEFIFYIDSDDDSYTSLEEWVSSLTNPPFLKIITGERIVLSQMWNECWKEAKADIFMHCGDDIRFRRKHWDNVVVERFAQSVDKIMFVYGSDGYQPVTFGTHGFLHRNWTNVVGCFVPPYFSSDYNDTWLNDVSKMINRHVYVNIYTEHLHPVAGKYHLDKTHRERLDRGERDRVEELYYSVKMKAEREQWAIQLERAIKVFKKTNIHHDHVLGTCYYCRETKVAYINIPKNASTTLKVLLEGKGWVKKNFLKDKIKINKFIAVLRDPEERWISAVNYMFSSRRTKAYEHIEKQTYFLCLDRLHQIAPIYYFQQNKDLLSNINDFLNLNFPIHEKLNSSKEQMIKILPQGGYSYDDKYINSNLFLYADRALSYSRVEDFYREDTDFIKNVNYTRRF